MTMPQKREDRMDMHVRAPDNRLSKVENCRKDMETESGNSESERKSFSSKEREEDESKGRKSSAKTKGDEKEEG